MLLFFNWSCDGQLKLACDLCLRLASNLIPEITEYERIYNFFFSFQCKGSWTCSFTSKHELNLSFGFTQGLIHWNVILFPFILYMEMLQSVIMEVQRLYKSVMYIYRKCVLLFVWNIQRVWLEGMWVLQGRTLCLSSVVSGLVINERITVSF